MCGGGGELASMGVEVSWCVGGGGGGELVCVEVEVS